FLEYVTLYGTYYGSSRAWVNRQQELGKHVFLVIDTQGALQLKGKLEAIFIFIHPPSLEALKERLMRRNSESEEMLKRRLEWAERELQCAGEYGYQIINDDLRDAYQVLRSILIAACHRTKNEE